MQAADAIRKNPVTVNIDTNIGNAARVMNERAVGAVIVLDGVRPVGIVTDRDLVVRGLAVGLPPDARIDAVMSTALVTLAADADVRDAFRIFDSHPLRRLPVVDEGTLIGVITADDLLIDLVGDLASLARPITGQVIFGHPDARTPVSTR